MRNAASLFTTVEKLRKNSVTKPLNIKIKTQNSSTKANKILMKK